MALYVAIALLAALAAINPDRFTRRETLLLIWGTALGLAVAHYVAFRLASSIAKPRHLSREDVRTAGVQFLGAMSVPAMCTLTGLVFADDDSAVEVAELTLAGMLGVTGYLAGRGNGAKRGARRGARRRRAVDRARHGGRQVLADRPLTAARGVRR